MKIKMEWKGSDEKGYWIEVTRGREIRKFNGVEEAIVFIRECDELNFAPCGSPC